MNWRILVTGKPSQAYAKQGVAEYEKRMTRFAKTSITYLKQDNPDLYRKAAGDSFRIVLDERGAQCATAAFADKVSSWELDGVKEVSVWIGGSDGFSKEVRQEADLVLGLSEFTMMHELALLVWMEQLYRVYTIKAGLPYHRA